VTQDSGGTWDRRQGLQKLSGNCAIGKHGDKNVGKGKGGSNCHNHMKKRTAGRARGGNANKKYRHSLWRRRGATVIRGGEGSKKDKPKTKSLTADEKKRRWQTRGLGEKEKNLKHHNGGGREVYRERKTVKPEARGWSLWIRALPWVRGGGRSILQRKTSRSAQRGVRRLTTGAKGKWDTSNVWKSKKGKVRKNITHKEKASVSLRKGDCEYVGDEQFNAVQIMRGHIQEGVH